MIALPIYIIVVIILLIVYVVKNTCVKPKNFPPGPPTLPLWGTYWLFLFEDYFFSHKSMKKYAERYNTDVLGFQWGKFSYITCHSMDACKELLNRDEFNGRVDSFTVRTRGRGFLRGIFFTDGSFWHDQRRFSLRHLRDHGFGRRDFDIEEVTSHEIRKLIYFLTTPPKLEDSDICKTQGIVKMPDVLYGPALNSIHHSLSSKQFENYGELRKVGRAAVNFLRSMDTTGCALCLTPWIRYLAPTFFGYTSAVEDNQTLFNFAWEVILEHQETFNDEHHRDFIDVYLSQLKRFEENEELDTSFSLEQLKYLVTDYMFPSPVGIGHTFNYIFAVLMKQPEIQKKAQEQLDAVVGRSRLPTLDDRKELSYIEAILRESMRRDTIVPLGLSRRCTEDTIFRGFNIPKDTVVIANLWAAHNDSKLWGDPGVFRPERWLDEGGMILKKDVSLPFGAGKRLCAGETFARNTMFLMLAGLLQHFNFEVPDGYGAPNFNKETSGLTVTLKDYYVKCTER